MPVHSSARRSAGSLSASIARRDPRARRSAGDRSSPALRPRAAPRAPVSMPSKDLCTGRCSPFLSTTPRRDGGSARPVRLLGQLGGLREHGVAQRRNPDRHAAQLVAAARRLARDDPPLADLRDDAAAQHGSRAALGARLDLLGQPAIRPRLREHGDPEVRRGEQRRERATGRDQAAQRHAARLDREQLAVRRHAAERHERAEQHRERHHASHHRQAAVQRDSGHVAAPEAAVQHQIRVGDQLRGDREQREADQRDQHRERELAEHVLRERASERTGPGAAAAGHG